MYYFVAVIKGKIKETILDYELLTNEILNPEFGFTTKKHLTQTSSILGHLQNAELLKPNTSFIEFGAGKGLNIKNKICQTVTL